MKTKLIGLLVMLAAVGGVVAYKVIAKSDDRAAASPANTTGAPRVLLFADLAEADEDCGCGKIIRAVRGVAAKGIATRENDDELGRKYKVTTNPTVVILDRDGREQGRYEGESKDTIAKLSADLDKLPTRAR